MRIERDQVRALVVMAALVVLFVCGLWLPRHFKSASIQERIATAKAQIDMDTPAAQELPSLAKQIKELERSIKEHRQYIPAPTEQAAMLHEVSSDLQVQNATDQEIQTQAAVTGSDFGLMPVVVNFHASCPAVFEFVRKVEGSPRLVRISKLHLDGNPNSLSEPLRASVELCTFFTTVEGKGR